MSTRGRRGTHLIAMAVVILTLTIPASPQDPGDPMEPPPPVPPTATPPHPRDDSEDKEIRADERIRPDSELEWVLPDGMIDRLGEQVELYHDYSVRFECAETVRSVDYDGGTVDKEKVRAYRYLLERDDSGENLSELRQRPKGGEVTDAEPFPPAYAWVYLFSNFNQPFFAYRYLGERMEGFDWVREIEFRGALGFTDGRDIRQWEGTVLVDAATFTPIEINAQPRAQDERLEAEFRRWSRSFGVMGWKAGKKPMAYRASLQFRLRRDGLTFPTELRYDTLRAVSPSSMISVKASVRAYDDYRFYKTSTTETFEGSE